VGQSWSIYVFFLLDLLMLRLVCVCKHRGTTIFSRNHLGSLINLCVFLVGQVWNNRTQLICMFFGLVKLGITNRVDLCVFLVG